MTSDRHCGSTPAHCEIKHGCQSGCNGRSAPSSTLHTSVNSTVSTTTATVASTVTATPATSATAAAAHLGVGHCIGSASFVISVL